MNNLQSVDKEPEKIQACRFFRLGWTFYCDDHVLFHKYIDLAWAKREAPLIVYRFTDRDSDENGKQQQQ